MTTQLVGRTLGLAPFQDHLVPRQLPFIGLPHVFLYRLPPSNKPHNAAQRDVSRT